MYQEQLAQAAQMAKAGMVDQSQVVNQVGAASVLWPVANKAF